MPYRVKATKRAGYTNRRRDGFVFLAGEWTVLQDEQITPGILEDRHLVVEVVDATPTTIYIDPNARPGGVLISLPAPGAPDTPPATTTSSRAAACAGVTKSGKPCGGKPTASGFCMAHTPKE